MSDIVGLWIAFAGPPNQSLNFLHFFRSASAVATESRSLVAPFFFSRDGNLFSQSFLDGDSGALVDVSLVVSGRGAAWLAHQSGGLGVAGSNPVAPTSPPPKAEGFFLTAVRLAEAGHRGQIRACEGVSRRSKIVPRSFLVFPHICPVTQSGDDLGCAGSGVVSQRAAKRSRDF